jgi:hypothetical protein
MPRAPDASPAQPFDVLRLTNLDKRLRDAIAQKKLRLLRTSWLLSRPAGWRLPRRSALEELEISAGELPFLSPREAACWLECGRRHIAALSYAWLSVPHPDPAGQRLETVRKFLANSPHVHGLFWCASQTPALARLPTCQAAVAPLAHVCARPADVFTTFGRCSQGLGVAAKQLTGRRRRRPWCSPLGDCRPVRFAGGDDGAALRGYPATAGAIRRRRLHWWLA